MIQAKHHPLYYPVLVWYSKRIIQKRFARVIINNSIESIQTSALVIANHTSWWDGFWLHELVTRTFKKKFFFMMLEEQLRANKFLQYFGGFSIKKRSVSAFKTIEYTVELLKHSENAVLIFPQGKLESLYTQSFIFEKGVEVILKKTDSTQIIFVANLIEFLSNAKPSLYVYTFAYDSIDKSTVALQKAYSDFYVSCIELHQKTIFE